MSRLKVTSPGVLLILAVLSAGGIFLLDLYYLQPHLTGLEKASLREQAVRTEHTGRLVMHAEENGLSRVAAVLAEDAGIRALLARPERTARDAAVRIVASEVDLAWLCDPAGTVLWRWTRPPPEEPSTSPAAEEEQPVAATQLPPELEKMPGTGMLLIDELPAIFARQVVADETDPKKALGHLWVARRIQGTILGNIGSAVGGDLMFVRSEDLPESMLADKSLSQSSWLVQDDRLTVAWLVSGVGGGPLGYFRVELPVGQIHRQSVTARRMILIVLSLSVGLVLLVILGTHMLITGPIFRLLKRLQQMETGEAVGEELARDLHGEPLVLARRLESAFDKLAHMSKTDQLTGLANRRHFEEVLDCFYHQARRYNRPLSLFVLDVDFFKAINDTGGHQVGDELLKVVAAALEKACRKADLPARFGGDEFAVLLPETGALAAGIVAQRVREALSSEAVKAGSLEMNVTASIGVADLNAGEIDSPDTMMSVADQALYAAKELGRNRIVQAHDLNGLNWSKHETEDDSHVNVFCKKLAGLDTEFKDLFLRAVEEIVQLLKERAPHMADHARKVQYYAVLTAKEMELPDRVIKRIQIAAMLHDIGMVAMPDAILVNPGSLDEQQLHLLRKHPLISVRIMEGMEFLEQEIPAVRYHHERFDGKGYPEGIAGAAIPLTARILAVADAFDAMTSSRTFREAKSREDALEEIRAVSGSQLDPNVVEAFLAVAERLGEELTHVPGVETALPEREKLLEGAGRPA